MTASLGTGRRDAPVVVSFDIDGTMVFGHPPGPIALGFVRAVVAAGHVVGSASDRTAGDQSSLWAAHDVDVARLAEALCR